jgi:hypothetical protein
MRLLGAFSYRLRSVAQAGRLAVQGVAMNARRLNCAGVPHPALQETEQQIRSTRPVASGSSG